MIARYSPLMLVAAFACIAQLEAHARSAATSINGMRRVVMLVPLLPQSLVGVRSPL